MWLPLVVCITLCSSTQSSIGSDEHDGVPNINATNGTQIPLTFFYLTDQSAIVCNDGRMINATLNEDDPKSWLCGGPLQTENIKNETDFYKYSFTKYYMAGNTCEYSCNLTKNASIIIEGYWIKEKYGSCDEAKKHQDGMVKTIFCMEKQNCSCSTNEDFVNFSNTIKNIIEPNTCTITTLLDTFIWSDEWYLKNINASYLFWPGTYKDSITNEKYNCTVDFFFPVFGQMSEDQWNQSAALLKNSKHRRLHNYSPKYPEIDSPIVKQSFGQVQILLNKSDLEKMGSQISGVIEKKMPSPPPSASHSYTPSCIISKIAKSYSKLLPKILI